MLNVYSTILSPIVLMTAKNDAFCMYLSMDCFDCVLCKHIFIELPNVVSLTSLTFNVCFNYCTKNSQSLFLMDSFSLNSFSLAFHFIKYFILLF